MKSTLATDSQELNALRAVDFDWATRLQDVWRDPPHDVSELHAQIRDEFSFQLDKMRSATGDGRAKSPLGWVLVGEGGSGKTHLLGALRREAVRQRAGFVLVDMTDVRGFWDTLLQGYLDSIQEEYVDGQFQHEVLLQNFIQRIGPNQDASQVMQMLAHRKSEKLNDDVNMVLKALHRKYPQQANTHADLIRALVCLNSDDYSVFSMGMTWLQGQELTDDEQKHLGFRQRQQFPRQIVKGLSWFMNLSGPTVVAFDQLDPIVYEHSRASEQSEDEQNTSWQIIQDIGGGLGAIPDDLTNTLCIVSCIELTWQLLGNKILGTAKSRYQSPPRRLSRPESGVLHEALIASRLAPTYQKLGVTPAYPTWPFRQDAFSKLTNESFREVLKMCYAHQRNCVEAGAVTELAEFRVNTTPPDSNISPDKFQHLDDQLTKYSQTVGPNSLLDEKEEDERLAPLYQTALQCLVHEHEDRFPMNVDVLVEREFSGGKSNKPLHARLRFVYPDENSREQHYCVRVLQRKHHAAYKNRLKAAMTQSGIDKNLKFRHLAIVRVGDPPGGSETEKLTEAFRQAGGRFYEPGEQELRTLSALRKLLEDNDPDLISWLRNRRPVTQLNLHEVLAPGSPFEDKASKENSHAEPVENKTAEELPSDPKPNPTSNGAPQTASNSTSSPSITPIETPQKVDIESTPPTTYPGELPLGSRIFGGGASEEVVTLPLHLLAKHTMILGGSGSGKSVTVRRLVEEAALAGIPSIVVDCAQDMCCFDERWPHSQEHWRNGDQQRADQLHQTIEQIVWTPGSLSSGNPLNLRPLPDFSSVKDDPEELQDAVGMVCDGLREVVAKGKSQKSQNKEGVLSRSLRFFARHFPQGGLQGYIDLLADLPQEAQLNIGNEKKLAEEMADSLKIEREKNPLLQDGGTSLDPLVLFGDDAQRDTVRISVLSLLKLQDTAAHSFLNQLAMQLFSWIKANPTPPNNRPLRGLLVIDEARDFVPSQKSTECKESLARLAAQARKYSLGLVFATQHPKDIDTKIVGNCATHLYGLNNSPASLDTLQDLMAQKGGSGADIPKLKAGQFYIYNADAGHKAPLKMQMPMSLSFSPKNPLEENQIIEKAGQSRQRLGRTV